MRALRLRQQELCLLSDAPDPIADHEEALIRVTLAGICSTDLELTRGYYPFDGILGHEFVGVVESCESATQWTGKRVVGTINLSPGCVGACGLRCPEQCPHRTVLGIAGKDGAFAEYLTLPVENLLEIPAELSDQEAVFTEPLAAACRIAEQCEVDDRDVLVIGPGRLGLLCAQVLRHHGARVVVLGRSAPSLQLPLELGLPTILEADDGPLPSDSFDLVVEATANETGLRRAVELCRPNGIIVLKSTYANDPSGRGFKDFAPVLATVVVKELTIVGSRCGPFDRALEVLQRGVVQVLPMIERIDSLENAIEAFTQAAQPGVRKILLQP